MAGLGAASGSIRPQPTGPEERYQASRAHLGHGKRVVASPRGRCTEVTLDAGGAEKKRTSLRAGSLSFLVAETENGHMTEENGRGENRTRQTQIGRGWTVAGLRR
ncbi:hypothetical protein NDU88_006807 [Pleurodeles waltl]|uniref:Uncharacterized protein n=1 Tax=Pleurodeles waltl TaxID=8319 RepID=A0AAV7PRQ5_PLEWA|nr:hypothetical protein NDU88_006807 [Pleurodeles waltl]